MKVAELFNVPMFVGSKSITGATNEPKFIINSPEVLSEVAFPAASVTVAVTSYVVLVDGNSFSGGIVNVQLVPVILKLPSPAV